MLGFRGASRYYSERYRDGFGLECQAIRRVREQMGLTNVVVMIPFCRTLEEADLVLAEMAKHGLVRGEHGLEVYVMAEIPSNVILAKEFGVRFDGFSIGSNDLTQLTLGVDRDNALLTAAEVVRRIGEFQPETHIHEIWRRFIESMGYPEEISGPLLAKDGLDDVLEFLPLGMARQFHACTHTTFAPTVIHGGSKLNIIPDSVELDVDIRTLPGHDAEMVMAELRLALGDLADVVTFEQLNYDPSSASPTETPLWDSLSRVTQQWYPGSETVPFLTVGATDARFFRRADKVAYGFGLFSENLSFEDFGRMFHGDDERIDTRSLGLSTEMWEAVANDLLLSREG